MANKVFIETCKTLRRRGFSLNGIARKTGRSKTSIYFHIRNIPVSDKRRAEWVAQSTARIVRFNRRRRGLSLLGRYPKLFHAWTPNTVSLISHLLFDGEIKRYGCTYNNRNEVLVNRVEMYMKELYDFEPKKYYDRRTGVLRVSYYNVVLGAYVMRKADELLRDITRLPKEYKRAFLKSFFDDEGCMDFRPEEGKRRVRGYQKNVRILATIKALLVDFGIESTLQKPNEVVITGKTNLSQFQREIGFSAGVRINGDRTNSVWKQHLEKRVLLHRALASFTYIERMKRSSAASRSIHPRRASW